MSDGGVIGLNVKSGKVPMWCLVPATDPCSDQDGKK